MCKSEMCDSNGRRDRIGEMDFYYRVRNSAKQGDNAECLGVRISN